MATANIKGEERLIYTPPGESEVTFYCAVPLRQIRNFTPVFRRRRFDFWTDDNENRRVVRIGRGVNEIVWNIRVDDDPVGLKKMLRHGLEDDVTIQYKQSAAGTAYPFRIVDVDGSGEDETLIRPDRDAHWYGKWEATFRARRTDGGDFDGILPL